MNAALQNAGALTVGENTGEGFPIYNIGYDSYILPIGDVKTVNVWRGLEETGEWIDGLDNEWAYNLDAKTYAEFTIAGSGPDVFTLTVNKAGDGSGTVTSAPSGINCGSSCSAEFDDGTSITLTATPVAGSAFTSWSGCDYLAQNECSVIMTQATTVTATFAKSRGAGINPGIMGIVLEED